MSNDDPFEHFRSLLNQSARLAEISRSPLEKLSRADDERRSLLRLALNEPAETWSAQAQRLIRDVERLPEALSKLEDDFARDWTKAKGALADPIAAALEAAGGRHGALIDDPLFALQEALQAKALSVDGSKSRAFLKLDEQVNLLRGTLADEAVASALGTFSRVIARFDATKNAVTAKLAGDISRLAEGMALPHLQAVASDWTTLAQGVDLSSLPLLHSALIAISDTARQPDPASFASLFERWEQVVEVSRSQYEDRRLSPATIGFLLNLLFFLLGIAYQNSASKDTANQLERLENGQSSMEAKLDEAEAAAERANTLRAEELAAIRQILDELVEADEPGPGPADIRVATEDVQLRISASPDANVVCLIPLGARVEVVDQAEGYCRVRYFVSETGQNRTGWIPQYFLEAAPD